MGRVGEAKGWISVFVLPLKGGKLQLFKICSPSPIVGNVGRSFVFEAHGICFARKIEEKFRAGSGVSEMPIAHLSVAGTVCTY